MEETKRKGCAYCGDRTAKATSDHVIPKCLWNDDPLPNMVVTVPTCERCNNYWSRHEGRFRSLLVVMADARHPLIRRIIDGTLLRHVKTDARFGHRLIGTMHMAPVFSKFGVYTGVHPAFEMDWFTWDSVIGKIVRGMHYHDTGHPLPANFVVQSKKGNGFWDDVDSRQIIDRMTGEWSSMGDGDEVFVGKRAYAVADPDRRFYLLRFYRSVCIFAWTSPAKEADGHDPSTPKAIATFLADRERVKRAMKKHSHHAIVLATDAVLKGDANVR